MRFVRFFLKIVVVLALAIFILRLIYPLPSLQSGEVSAAIPVSKETNLGRTFLPLMDENEGKTGVIPLADGRDALVSRIMLARAAQQTIDIQYYIWQTDTTGWILLDELRIAAERGVRVRMLLDDNGIPGLDNVLADLAKMDNVEIRLFNPFTFRQPKLLSYVFDPFRLNRRMHNKSMTVDGVATIIGGRNIGDIYFAYGEGTAYFDYDILAVGPGAADVSQDFDRYWTSESSYNALDILAPPDGGLDELLSAVTQAMQNSRASEYAKVLNSAPVISRLLAGEDLFEWTVVKLISDDPAKGLGKADEKGLLLGRLTEMMGQPERSLDIVSAYLIPGAVGTALFEDYLEKNIEIRLVTNSLEATDVPIVHSAWMGYRDELVRAGAEVLELRSRPRITRTSLLSQVLTGSQSSLHAKTFAVDGERIFIGSFNFDPRSATLNTEMGFLVESPQIARTLSETLDQTEVFYRVSEDRDGKMQWTETIYDSLKMWTEEPNTSRTQRIIVKIMSYLPFEWVL